MSTAHSIGTITLPISHHRGVAERGTLNKFSRIVLLDRVFRGLRVKGRSDYFNSLYGRKDLTSPKDLLSKLSYTDSLLLAMLLRPGEYSEPWEIEKYRGFAKKEISLPDTAGTQIADYAPLGVGEIGFPAVHGCYVHVSETTEPLRVEVFGDLGSGQVAEAARRVYLY